MKHFNVLSTVFVTMAFLSIGVSSQAALVDPLTTIELENPVYFLAPDGSNVLIEAGTYAVEPAEEWIRVMSGERRDALLIEARKGTHKLELEQRMAMSLPGESEEEKDNHYVLLLLPGGESLEATGTYSGIRARGFFKNTFKKVKKAANNTYKKARKEKRQVQKLSGREGGRRRRRRSTRRDTSKKKPEKSPER